MQFSLETTVKVTAEHKPGAATSKHISTDFYLEVSENLDENKYMSNDDVLTAEGARAVTQCLIQGLVGNIHFSQQNGYRNDVEHLRYIISELERGFVQIAEGSKGVYTPIK
jgi:hypothetical protein